MDGRAVVEQGGGGVGQGRARCARISGVGDHGLWAAARRSPRVSVGRAGSERGSRRRKAAAVGMGDSRDGLGLRWVSFYI